MRPPFHLLSQTIQIIKKDLRRELRSKEITLTTVSFSILLVLIFVFALRGDSGQATAIFPGLLWVCVLFSSTLAIPRTFAAERDSGCLRALAMIPGTERSLYLGKLFINALFMLVFEAALVPMLLLTFQMEMSADQWGAFVLMLLGGTFGFATLGTLLSAMLVHHRLRDVLLPLLLYPLLVPLIIGGVEACGLIFEAGTEPGELWSWIRVLFVADFIFFLGSLALFGWVLRAIE